MKMILEQGIKKLEWLKAVKTYRTDRLLSISGLEGLLLTESFKIIFTAELHNLTWQQNGFEPEGDYNSPRKS